MHDVKKLERELAAIERDEKRADRTAWWAVLVENITLATALLLVLPFGATDNIFGMAKEDEYTAVLVTVIIFLFTTRIKDHALYFAVKSHIDLLHKTEHLREVYPELETIEGQVRLLHDEVHQKLLACWYIGTHFSVHKYVFSKKAAGTTIFNTYIANGSRIEIYDEGVGNEIRNSIAKFVADGGKWHDLISDQKEFEHMKSVVFSGKGKYTCAKLPDSFKAINFTMIYGTNPDFTEVLFGGKYQEKEKHSHMLSSAEGTILQTFTDYWELLDRLADHSRNA